MNYPNDVHCTDVVRAVLEQVTDVERSSLRWLASIYALSEEDALAAVPAVFSLIEKLNHNGVVLTGHSIRLSDLTVVAAYNSMIRSQARLVVELIDALEYRSERLESNRLYRAVEACQDSLSRYRRYETTPTGVKDLGPIFPEVRTAA